jgi:hypothetical protein
MAWNQRLASFGFPAGAVVEIEGGRCAIFMYMMRSGPKGWGIPQREIAVRAAGARRCGITAQDAKTR